MYLFNVIPVCFLVQILVGELAAFFLKPESPQEKTIVTADCCYFSPMLRRIVRFLGKKKQQQQQENTCCIYILMR